ncbi:hypothetical protein DsansV1_C24g0180921 [Dioscorea sansibarensis]
MLTHLWNLSELTKAQRNLSKHSIEERAKLEEETLVNFNNFKKQKLLNKTTNDLKECTVVTILVVVAGSWKLPVLNSIRLKQVVFYSNQPNSGIIYLYICI